MPTAHTPPGAQVPPATPGPGLQAIRAACLLLYPDQPSPLQVATLQKYWTGGPDPLDYISMFAHPASPSDPAAMPEHWHYVTMGFSDLYGDARIHNQTVVDGPSGFGFELTFRLRRSPGEHNPPTWPAGLFQSLARYVFTSKASLCAGDHIPWRRPLEEVTASGGAGGTEAGGAGGGSRIRHMLLVEDPQLGRIATPHGFVTFLQIVGLCDDELRFVQRWTGLGVAELLSTRPATGGPLLITDMRRGESLLEREPGLEEEVLECGGGGGGDGSGMGETGLQRGSSLSGVTTRLTWEDLAEGDKEIDVVGMRETPPPPSASSAARRGVQMGGPTTPLLPPAFELVPPRSLDGVHLKLSLEAGEVLPVAMTDRLRHGRHFTLTLVGSELAVTLVPSRVTGAFVSEEDPYVVRGHWLQVYLPDDFLEQLEYQVTCLAYPADLNLPLVFCWPERRFKISILPNEDPQLTVPPPPSTASPSSLGGLLSA